MIGPDEGKMHGQLRLSEATNTTLTTADKYYKIAGTFIDGNANAFIIVDNKLKYIGPSGAVFLFVGVSDLEVNKACDIVYSLFKNGEAVVGAQTPHGFASPSKTATIAITAIISLNQDDELDVYAKSDTDATVISVKNLNIVAWG